MSFDKLNKKELLQTAIDDFGVDVKESDSVPSIKAALAESGVTYDLYLKAHPEKQEPSSNAVTTEAMGIKPTEPVEVITKERSPKLSASEQYLIKMVRENPLFEVAGHRFTQNHPYALVSATEAQLILTSEEGFRQAYPDELADYYG